MTIGHRIQIQHLWDGSPAPAEEHVVLSISVVAPRLVIEVEAPLHADVPPPTCPPGPTPRLWEHEVVELFIADAGERYLEIELGPFGHHLVLQLQGVRNVVEERLPLAYSTGRCPSSRGTRGPARWTGSASLPLDLLPTAPTRFNAYAIHGQGEERRYLAHAPTRGTEPDFHRLESFVRWPFA